MSNDNYIYRTNIATPLGMMYACADSQGVCLLDFDNPERLEKEYADLIKRLKTNIVEGDNEHLLQLKHELSEYFLGLRSQFEVALHPVGTEFQNQVWQALLTIPYGQTISYSTQAERMNHKKAVRAVASANGKNKISIVIPCHRVIGSNGKLTGYGGGMDRKQWLLDFEEKTAALLGL